MLVLKRALMGQMKLGQIPGLLSQPILAGSAVQWERCDPVNYCSSSLSFEYTLGLAILVVIMQEYV